jgi:hypothetical protein
MGAPRIGPAGGGAKKISPYFASSALKVGHDCIELQCSEPPRGDAKIF